LPKQALFLLQFFVRPVIIYEGKEKSNQKMQILGQEKKQKYF